MPSLLPERVQKDRRAALTLTIRRDDIDRLGVALLTVVPTVFQVLIIAAAALGGQYFLAAGGMLSLLCYARLLMVCGSIRGDRV